MAPSSSVCKSSLWQLPVLKRRVIVVALQVGNDRGTQYRHGVYYHTDEQKIAAQEVFTKVESEVSPIEEDVRSFVCLYYHTEEQKEAAPKVLQVLTEVETGVSSMGLFEIPRLCFHKQKQ